MRRWLIQIDGMTLHKQKEGEADIPSEPIYQLHSTGSSMLAVSLWVEECSQLHADHRLHAETMGET